MATPLLIDLRNLPAEGKQLSGNLPAAVFELPADDPIQATSPVTYDLHAVRDGEDLIVTGELGATFNLECGRCLQRFDFRVDQPDYQADVPIEKEPTIDLTDLLREDILLALPGFPRCEHGNVEPRECPAEGKFDTVKATKTDEPPPSGPGVWKALDELKK